MIQNYYYIIILIILLFIIYYSSTNSENFGVDTSLTCPSGQLISSDYTQCVAQCNAGEIIGENNNCIPACWRGRDGPYKYCFGLNGGWCTNNCADRRTWNGPTKCQVMPNTPYISSYNTATSNYDTCLSVCPNNQVLVNNQYCDDKCPPQYVLSLDKKSCIMPPCPEGQTLSADRKSCIISCSAEQVPSIDGTKCLAPCPKGQTIGAENICIKVCEAPYNLC
jgi:hypothetical protein